MNKKQVLICDDNESTLEVLEIILDKMAEVIPITSGKAALDYLYNAPVLPDLLILDLMLPDLEGDDAIQMLRNEPRFQNIPIILMSGVIMNIDYRAEAIGANDYIKKPFTMAELKSKVENYLK